MNLNVLWQLSPARAYLISLLTSLVGVSFFTLVETPSQDVAPLLGTVCTILMFVFLTRLPQGTWWQRLLQEIGYVVGSVLLYLFGLSLFLALGLDSDLFLSSDVFLIFAALSAFSHVAVRAFVRPFAVWRRMRRYHLVWEITHAQLRLVLLTMMVLFLLLMIFTYNMNRPVFNSTPDFITNLITLSIAIAGFLGIVTGILLFIVVIPASIISYLTARQITRRLDNLIQVTRAVRHADYDARVNVEGADEIARLQTDFNAMMDELDKARQALEHERDAVRDLLDSRRRLFANVSHELRTPVATIRAYLDSLKSSQARPDDVAIIEREVLRLGHLIDDVFTLARADVDHLQYTVKPLEVSCVLERTVQAMHPQAWSAKKVEVVLDYQPQIPLVMADEERLEQVLYNLLRNAVRHTSPGGLIRVSACTEPETVSIEVQDTGTGIKPEDLPHIWERFYRSAEVRAGDASGSGLGLALVKEMVVAMGGTVDVTSEVGRGSRFMVGLRRAQ